MLQIAVCDDEQFYREKIKCLLEQYLHEHHPEYMVQTFSSGSEFLSVQENNVKYDVVFLDISMEQINGIQTAKQIRTFHSDTFIVFVTAFIDYALEGYKVNAIRYILKDQLETAVSECMNAILQKMQKKQVVFAFSDGERALYTDNILYIESSLGNRQIRTVWYVRECLILAGSNLVCLSVNARFLVCLLCPLSGDDIVCHAVFHKVHGYHSKLLACAAL